MEESHSGASERMQGKILVTIGFPLIFTGMALVLTPLFQELPLPEPGQPEPSVFGIGMVIGGVVFLVGAAMAYFGLKFVFFKPPERQPRKRGRRPEA